MATATEARPLQESLQNLLRQGVLFEVQNQREDGDESVGVIPSKVTVIDVFDGGAWIGFKTTCGHAWRTTENSNLATLRQLLQEETFAGDKTIPVQGIMFKVTKKPPETEKPRLNQRWNPQN